VASVKVNTEEVLKNWESLNRELIKFNEDQCWDLLKAERAGLCRTQFLLRIYGRGNKLRGKRERKDLFK
jgi:hypothetical protein